MKTEKEFSDYFQNVCLHDSEDKEFVAAIAKTYWNDLTTHLLGYFVYEDRLAITQRAAHLLSQNIKIFPRETVWASVIRDFVQKNSWGFQTVSKKPKTKQTEEQKIFWKLFKYIWALFQSLIIFKTIVFYFGLESATHPENGNSFWMWVFFSLSVCSSVFFVYKNRKDTD